MEPKELLGLREIRASGLLSFLLELILTPTCIFHSTKAIFFKEKHSVLQIKGLTSCCGM